MRRKVLAIVMAGGMGTRLFPLTMTRSKPAVPFGGRYRIIDFVLNNFVNSGLYSVFVLTQFKSQSLAEHIMETWRFSGTLSEHFIIPVPAQMRTGESWYKGTADAIYQNLNLISDRNPHLVAVFGGDHIYKMDVSQMIAYHVEKGAETTVAAIPYPRERASQFGIIQVNQDWQIVGFQEKPADPAPIPGQPDWSLVSMGNYIFNRHVLVDEVTRDAQENTAHDFGKDILPSLVGRRLLYAYDFRRNRIPGQMPGEENDYWRDVGTLDSYFEANMDLKNVSPVFNLYNPSWPIRTAPSNSPPAKFVHDSEGRVGSAVNSIVGEGSIVSGANVRDCVIGRDVRVHSFAQASESILLDGVEIGRGAKIRRAIVDKNVIIGPGEEIGFDLEADAKRFTVTETGIVAIQKAATVIKGVTEVIV